MKQRLLFLLTALLLPMVSFGAKVTVNVATEGTLEQVLSEQSVTNITDLTITGRLTAADIAYLRAAEGLVANLAVLDLKDVTLVASDEPYYTSSTTYYYISDEETIKTQGIDTGLGTGYTRYHYYSNNLAGAFRDMLLEKVVLPSSITRIGRYCFSNCKLLETVEVPGGLTAVDEHAFQQAISLPSIDMAGISVIGDYAFDGCTSLSSVDFTSLTQMGEYAFNGCTSLTSIKLPQQLSALPKYAFNGCTKLSSVDFSTGLETIGEKAFADCASISTLILPEGLQEIAKNAFSGCSIISVSLPGSLKTLNSGFGSKLTSIAFAEGLERIGEEAFRGSNLTTITFPASLKSIGESAFSDSSLETITFTKGNGGLSIEGLAFEDLYELKEVAFAEGLESIGRFAFSGYNKLKSIVLPEGLKSIGSYAFAHTPLTDVHLPSTLQEMGQLAFCDTPWAEKQTVDKDGILYYGTIAVWYSKDAISGTKVKIKEGTLGVAELFLSVEHPENITAIELPATLKTIGESAFKGTGISQIDLPESLESIGSAAFKNCTSLTKITIPENVKLIEYCYSDNAFDGCSSLLQVIINARNLSKNSCFGKLSSLSKITIGSEVSVLPANFIACSSSNQVRVSFEDRVEDSELFFGEKALPYDNITTLILPNCRIALADYAFSGVTAPIEVPGVIVALGKNAFYKSGLIGTVRLSKEVTSVSENAFMSCGKLGAVLLPEGLKTIEKYAFCWSSGLTSVTIPNGVESIGDFAFNWCTALSSPLSIPGTVISIGESAFNNCTGLTSLTIEDGVCSIEEDAFNKCTGITSLSIPGSVKKIGNSAFLQCKGLTTLSIKDGVESIGDFAFQKCESLTSLSIPGSVKSVGKQAFQMCSGLQSLTVAEGVESLGEYAFHDIKNLNSVDLPASLSSIGYACFLACKQIKTVISRRTEPIAIVDQVFDEYAFSNATLYVPKGCKLAYSTTDYWSKFFRIIEGRIPGEEIEVPDDAIIFADSYIEQKCVDKWDTDHDGFLSKDEAAAVTSFDGWLFSYASMESFDELQYFTNLTEIGEAVFYACRNLANITIPKTVTSIGSSAFYDCNLKTLVVLNPIPVPITSNTFSYYNYTTLYVPKGSKEAYSTADIWKLFTQIKEGIPGEDIAGDANGDGVVDEKDIVEIVSYLLGKPSEKFNEIAADANGDSVVNAADIVAIVNILQKK